MRKELTHKIAKFEQSMNNISELDFENSLHRRHSTGRSVCWFQLSLPSNALDLRLRDGHFS